MDPKGVMVGTFVIIAIVIGVALANFIIINMNFLKNINPLIILIVSVTLLAIAFSRFKRT